MQESKYSLPALYDFSGDGDGETQGENCPTFVYLFIKRKNDA